jgi:hypothetical protein
LMVVVLFSVIVGELVNFDFFFLFGFIQNLNLKF